MHARNSQYVGLSNLFCNKGKTYIISHDIIEQY